MDADRLLDRSSHHCRNSVLMNEAIRPQAIEATILDGTNVSVPGCSWSSSAIIPVAVVALSTAVPLHYLPQAEAFASFVKRMPGYSHMGGVFDNSGVEGRYSSVPMNWYDEPKSWQSSNAVYTGNALDLLEKVTGNALLDGALGVAEIDAVVLVNSTGFAMPTLESRLADRVGFRPDIERTPIFGLGCAGGVTGLARAARIARSEPGTNVLLLVIELEGLNTHLNPASGAFVISSALFGDGAAAVVLRAGEPPSTGGAILIGPSGEHQWRDTTHMMGWDIADDGFDVVLSGHLPRFLIESFRPALDSFLGRHGLALADLDGFLFHPGGPRVLEAFEQALDIPSAAFDQSRAIMRLFGNMSSPTVFFVLEKARREGARGLHLMASPGPGLTASFALVTL